MQILRRSLAIILAASASGMLIIAGCGIMTAPFSVPAAVAENANFSFHGTVVDGDGKPLDGVLMSQQLDHHFWTPIAGGTETDEHHLRRVDGVVNVNERGRELNLTFTRDGYRDASYTIRATDAKSVHTSDGDWPIIPDFPIVMLSRTPPDTHLESWNDTISYESYPRQRVVDLANLRNSVKSFTDARGEDFSSLRPGMLYLTLTREAPHAMNAKGDVDPVEVKLPGKVALHITGADTGFIRIEPRIGFGPIQTSDTAPESGYAPTLEISRERLKAMRLADRERVIEAHEYFFIRANGRFGKGMVSWSQPYNAQYSRTPGLEFRIGLWMQPIAGDKNLRAHSTECTCK